MGIFVDIFVYIISGYLALTNTVANQILALTPEPEADTSAEVVEAEIEEEPISYELLPSKFSHFKIPDILLESAEYQEASVIAAGTPRYATTNPLEATVNIYCTFTTDDYIRTTTGTGFFVDAGGVIMTNAHVAQFLLLEETKKVGETECTIRTGSPATAKYKADLLYLPPAWLQEHASLIDANVPMGTGERDYALLYVTGTLDGSPLPATFPALLLDSDLLKHEVKDSEVVASGYPATALLTDSQAELTPLSQSTTVSELYTFGSNYADVFSIRGSAIGAQGSSGGPIVNSNGAVIGMIATRGDDVIDGPGSLRAITISHIHRTIEEETGFTLAENVSGNAGYRAGVFQTTLAPFLSALLETELEN